MHAQLRRILHWIGTCIALASIVFVTIKLYDYRTQLNFSRFGPEAWVILFAFAIAYAVANGLLLSAWRYLQCELGGTISRSDALRIFGISQLAKYVPGNIFHLAGRQALGMAAGLPAWALVKATFWELALISSAGALFGLLIIPLEVYSLPTGLEIGGFIISSTLVAIALWYYFGTGFAKAFGLYIIFLLTSSTIFIGVIAIVIEFAIIEPQRLTFLIGVYVVAWLIGLVTPGAPAGVGVRELILLKFLGDQLHQPDLLIAIIVGRVITVLGDVTFFAYTLLESRGKTNE